MKRRGLVLATGAIQLLFLGLIFAYSVVMAPLKNEFGWSVPGMTLLFSISIVSQTFGCIASGALQKRHSSRFVFFSGLACLVVGFIGSALANGETSLHLIYGTYGVIASFGIGLVYNLIVPTVTAWFPDKTGFAQGLCLMGYGLGGFVEGPILTMIYGVVDWRIVFVGIGVLFAVLVVASSIIVRLPTTEEALTLPAEKCSADLGEECRDVDTAHMVRDPAFFLLYLFLFLLGSIGMGITGIGRELPLQLGADAFTAAFVIGFVNVGSGCGRFFGGIVLDHLGRAKTMLSVACLFFVAVLSMIGSLVFSSVPLQTVACFLVGASWGSTIITMPFVTRKNWGQTHMAQNMSIVNSYSVFSAMIGSFGAGLIHEVVGSWVIVLAIMAAMAAAAFFSAVAMNRFVDKESLQGNVVAKRSGAFVADTK